MIVVPSLMTSDCGRWFLAVHHGQCLIPGDQAAFAGGLVMHKRITRSLAFFTLGVCQVPLGILEQRKDVRDHLGTNGGCVGR